MDHTFVFIGGLHRSGTSLFTRCLAEHPQASGFSDTGAIEDEGQHLQSVYHPANRHGGPGRFGFHDEAFLDESSPLVTPENRQTLIEEWSQHWDMSRPVLIEKSPPNLIRTRFLQALFPEARQIAVIRHPIAVACATQKWSWTSYTSLIEHWLVCHERLEQDALQLPQLHVVRYEDFVAAPDARLSDAFRYLGLEPQPSGLTVRDSINEAYFTRWAANRWNPVKRYDTDRAAERFEERVSRFGYSMREPARLAPAEVLVPAALEH
jgi:Sulfotransferase family